jgi:predicted DNA-binding transcriptional regulator YafY
MSRSERLIQVVQYLRSHAPPVRAEDIAEEMNISVRSVYRDIETLRNSGAIIDGEAGFGYTLEEDPALPPMLFSGDEMEALVLGLREVMVVGDPVLAKAAQNALAKVKACLPGRMRQHVDHSILHAKRYHLRPKIKIDISALRSATREERAIEMHYTDANDAQSHRKIYPLALVFMDETLMLLSWCTLRKDFRSFRADRIVSFCESQESFRPKRVALLKRYLKHLEEVQKKP